MTKNNDRFNQIVTPRTAYQRSIGFEDEEIGIEKGLMNAKGDNNCFINAVIQALWHITPFRTSFSVLESHKHTIASDSESCIFCCLKIIFAQYEFGQDPILPTSVLREAMSKVFSSQNRFELGKFADATETLEEIIKLLHYAVTSTEEKDEIIEDENCEPPCFVHRVFRLNICEQQHCMECNQLSEPLMINDFVHYVYAATMREITVDFPRFELDQILKTANSMDGKVCTNTKSCKRSETRRHLLSNPEAFCVGIVWDSPDCSREEISLVLRGISEELDLNTVFDSMEGQVTNYSLKGMICYYGHHYDAYFYNKHENTWYVFDDAVVRKVEESGFKGVRNKCVLGKFQPSLLFYERTNPSSLSPITKRKSVLKDETTKTKSNSYNRQLEEELSLSKLDLAKREKNTFSTTKDTSLSSSIYSQPSLSYSSPSSQIRTKLKTLEETGLSTINNTSSPLRTQIKTSGISLPKEEESLTSSYFNARLREKEEAKKNEYEYRSLSTRNGNADSIFDVPSFRSSSYSPSSSIYNSSPAQSTIYQNKNESNESKTEQDKRETNQPYQHKSTSTFSSPYRKSTQPLPERESNTTPTNTKKTTSTTTILDTNIRFHANIPTNSTSHSKRNANITPIARIYSKPNWK